MEHTVIKANDPSVAFGAIGYGATFKYGGGYYIRIVSGDGERQYILDLKDDKFYSLPSSNTRVIPVKVKLEITELEITEF